MGDVASLIKSLSDFGGLGVTVAFLIWWNIWTQKCRDKADEQRRAEQLIRDEKRLNYDKERLEMDRDQASNIAALTGAIQELKRRL